TLIAFEGESITIWDAATGRELHRWEPWKAEELGKGGRSSMGVFSPDGRVLATVLSVRDPPLNDQKLQLWDAATGQEIRRWKPPKMAPRTLPALVFSPDGKLLVTGDWRATVQVWDVATGQELRRWKEPPGPSGDLGAHWVAFSPDGKTLFSSGGG